MDIIKDLESIYYKIDSINIILCDKITDEEREIVRKKLIVLLKEIDKLKKDMKILVKWTEN